MCRWRWTSSATFSPPPALNRGSWNANARWCCRSWARRATRLPTLCSIICKDQPLGWPILGEEKTVNGFSRSMLKDYMASQYRLESMTLVASGAVEHDAILKLAEEKCGGLNRGAVPSTVPAHYAGGDFRSVEDL